MTTQDVTQTIVLGGLLGIIGQGIRVMVGLKKLNEENSQKKSDDFVEEFQVSRIWLSIFMGFTVGVLAVIIKGIDKNFEYSKEAAFGIIAAGYSGADFIEGVFNSYIKKDIKEESRPSSTSPSTNQPSGDPQQGPSNIPPINPPQGKELNDPNLQFPPNI